MLLFNDSNDSRKIGNGVDTAFHNTNSNNKNNIVTNSGNGRRRKMSTTTNSASKNTISNSSKCMDHNSNINNNSKDNNNNGDYIGSSCEELLGCLQGVLTIAPMSRPGTLDVVMASRASRSHIDTG